MFCTFMLLLMAQGGVTQPDFNPTEWVNQADISDSNHYVETMYLIYERNMQKMRLKRGSAVAGVKWTEAGFSFAASDLPDLISLEDLIYNLISFTEGQRRMVLEGAKQGFDVPKYTNIQRKLIQRGLPIKDLQILDRYYDIDAAPTEFLISRLVTSRMLRNAAYDAGVSKEVIEKLDPRNPDQNLEKLTPHLPLAASLLKSQAFGKQLQASNTDIEQAAANAGIVFTRQDLEHIVRFPKVYRTQAVRQILAEFLAEFSPSSRRILLSYALENTMQNTSLWRSFEQPNLEESVENTYRKFIAMGVAY